MKPRREHCAFSSTTMAFGERSGGYRLREPLGCTAWSATAPSAPGLFARQRDGLSRSHLLLCASSSASTFRTVDSTASLSRSSTPSTAMRPFPIERTNSTNRSTIRAPSTQSSPVSLVSSAHRDLASSQATQGSGWISMHSNTAGGRRLRTVGLLWSQRRPSGPRAGCRWYRSSNRGRAGCQGRQRRGWPSRRSGCKAILSSRMHRTCTHPRCAGRRPAGAAAR